ncbi:hypothetical protein IE53DRAFT_155005 [Violaceomyces palustris]|uniref:Uncharacterized protein n=1 Tax=Violaceomyces palustris TaxID=1673888 RepID=A0ACD0NU59_9BASI|nr:hypothetical protein IE53DRAFT_155005 [Violaceomyces palustris]
MFFCPYIILRFDFWFSRLLTLFPPPSPPSPIGPLLEVMFPSPLSFPPLLFHLSIRDFPPPYRAPCHLDDLASFPAFPILFTSTFLGFLSTMRFTSCHFQKQSYNFTLPLPVQSNACSGEKSGPDSDL